MSVEPLLDESSSELSPESPPDELDESEELLGGLLRSLGDGENVVPVFTSDVPPEVDEVSSVEVPLLVGSPPDELDGSARSDGFDGE